MIKLGNDPEFPLKVTLEPLPLFPTYDSLQDVVDLAESDLPILTKNGLLAILAIYHNTLLNQIKQGNP